MPLRPLSPRARRWLLRLMLLTASSAVSLLLMEAAVRVLLPHYSPRAQILFETQPDGVALGRRGATVRQANSKGDFDVSVTFNQLGLRDRKDLRAAKPGALFAVGDSFTMGWGVEEEERFSSQLERLLGEPVFNVAIPTDLRGYQRLLAYTEEQGVRVTRLVLGICMENDLRDYRDSSPSRPAPARAPAQPAFTGRAKPWLKTHSALFIAACHNLQKILFIRHALEAAGLAKDGEVIHMQNIFNETMLASCRDEVLRLAKDREVTVLLIPARGLWLGSNQETERRVHAHFAALLRDAGLRVVDPAPRFERDGPPLGCYFKADPHWNARGHRVAAEELAKAMKPGSASKTP